MVHPASHRISRVPHYSGYPRAAFGLVYGAITHSGVAFQTTSFTYLQITTWVLQPPGNNVTGIWAISRSLVTTRKISFDFFSTRYLDISVPRVSFVSPMNSARDIPTHRYGLPHSDISGSTVVCTFPKLIAACHVLHRLFAPMHSPYALSNLNYIFMKHHVVAILV